MSDQDNEPPTASLPKGCEARRWTNTSRSLPEHLPPCTAAPAAQAVPRIIWQTWVRSTNVPERMVQAAFTWIVRNPEYEYRFLDDAAQAAYVEAWPEPKVREAYKSPLLYGAGRSDLWRLLAIYDHGGVYMDIDTEALVPMREILHPEDEAVSGYHSGAHGGGDFHQWGLIFKAKHPFIRATIDEAVEEILHHKARLAGPDVLHNGMQKVLHPSAPGSFSLGIPKPDANTAGITCTRNASSSSVPVDSSASTGSVSVASGGAFLSKASSPSAAGYPEVSFRVLPGDEFDGCIRFKYAGYFADLKEAKVRYYWHEMHHQEECGRWDCR